MEQENAKLKRLVLGAEPGEAGVEGHRLGKLLSPELCGCPVIHARDAHGMSERRVCRCGETATRHTARRRHSETTRIRLPRPSLRSEGSQYGRDGYRRITGRGSRRAGWHVGKDRVERIWRLGEGLKVPKK